MPTTSRFERAAITVLQKAKKPLTIREIVDRMTDLGLVIGAGKTPQNSMSNTIRRANERRKCIGKPPLFIASREGKAVRYSLS